MALADSESGCRRPLLLLATLLLATPALAGPTQPALHAFERVGPSTTSPVLALHLPDSNRALVFDGDGDLSLVSGDGFFRQSLGRLPVDDACTGRTVLAAVWDPDAEGERLFVTYRAEGSGELALGRLELAADLRSFDFELVFASAAPASCDRVGGGLAFAADGTLLLGIGDHGDSASAANSGARTGKILRLTVDGAPPQAPYEPNPLSPFSPVYAIGVRDPVAISTEPFGDSWFLDRGPAGGADELNLVAPLVNHGWGGTELSGHQDAPGDPHHAWSPPVGVTGLAAAGLVSDIVGSATALVSTDTGQLSEVSVNPADPLDSSEELLYTPDPGGPQGLWDPRPFADGSAHVVGDDGQLWRLRLRSLRVLPEPSRSVSVVPSILRKDGAGGFVLAGERVGRNVSYGLHVGDLSALGPGYSHSDSADRTLAEEAESGDALSRWALSEDDLGGSGASVYVLLGASDGCFASSVGVDSDGFRRPGGTVGDTFSVAVLGDGTHDVANVVMTEILSGADGLSVPRDLEFHPDNVGQLWIVNRQDDSTVIVDDTGRAGQTARYIWAPSGNHFLAQPSALAFGPGTNYFATSHEEDDFTQGPPPAGTPADFMGPTLWTNNDLIYEGGHGSHYDMLHNTPNGAGIAWESGSAYWLFDGWHQSLTRYDFRDDHGLGGSDHTDGIIDRYAEGQVSYVPDVPSHLVWDPDTSELLVADTGNNRIAVFDPEGATVAGPIGPNYDGCTMNGMDGGTLTTLIDGGAHGLVAPSGLELHDCKLFVTDNATSIVYAFSRSGELIDWLDTELPPGSLMGMAFDPRDGDLYVVDAVGDRIFRIQPR